MVFTLVALVNGLLYPIFFKMDASAKTI